MCPGLKSFYESFLLFVCLFISELEWLDTDEEFKGKRNIHIKKKIKTWPWPIYREHEGMWSRSNFSPTTCACVCDVHVSGAFAARFLLHFSQLCLIFSRVSRLQQTTISNVFFQKHCMTKSSTSCTVWHSNIPMQCAALYSHRQSQRLS